MLAGVERLVDLCGTRSTGGGEAAIGEAVRGADADRLGRTGGHFAAAAREGQTVRLARTLGFPLRYFVAKRMHGPFLIAADRIDRIYEYCRAERIGWQFDPLYTRMVPAHYLVEIEQIGCPDPNPRLRRFFDPPVGGGPDDPDALGSAYAGAALQALREWLAPRPGPVGLLFSGGIDSGAVFLLARQALRDLGRSSGDVRAFTLDLGGGADAAQAERWVRELGLAEQWEALRLADAAPDLERAIAVIEDYHPLDVECAAMGLLALGEIRRRFPALRFLLDGDGGDENLKSYPLEDSDLTLSSVLRCPLLYHEGWGIDAMKHSLTYSGGLSRAYVRTYAPAAHYGFESFSPFTTRPVLAAALAVPFERLAAGSPDRLYALKGEIVRRGVRAVTGLEMPLFPKRRFQEGASSDSYRRWRVGRAWCRRVFLRQWEERLRAAWEGERVSGNAVPS